MALFAKQKSYKNVELLEVSHIAANPFQPRRKFEPESLRELAISIEQNGLLQPVTVRRTDKGYELIAGERRLMACKMLHKEHIPAIVESFDDTQTAIFGLIENLQRRDLNYFEQARGMQKLMQLCNLTQEQLARQIGKSQPTVANKMRLLSFEESTQRKMLENGLTERHARALLKLIDQKILLEALNFIIQKKLNVGETEQFIEGLLTPKPVIAETKQPTKRFIVRDFRIFMNTISGAISTMKMAGIDVDAQKEEDDDFIRYTMCIAKKSAYRPPSTV